MRGLRLCLAHAISHCAREAQDAETKTLEEVDMQHRNRQELVFEVVSSTSSSLPLHPFSNMVPTLISDQKMNIDMQTTAILQRLAPSYR